MKQTINLQKFTAISGFSAAAFFFIKIGVDLTITRPDNWHLLFGYSQTVSSFSTLLNHIFVVFTVLFSSAFYLYCKNNQLEELKEATILYAIAYLTLFIRTFLMLFEPHSFSYILSAGFQILLTLMSMFFFMISFINMRGMFIYALLTASDMLIYFLSVIYSMLMTDFTLPNLGSIIAAVLNICFMSIFVLRHHQQTSK